MTDARHHVSPPEQLVDLLLGRRRLVLSGDYPYYRDAPALWERKLAAMKAAGIEVVTFYVPWRHHLVNRDDPSRVRFDGDGSRNLLRFVDLIGAHGLLAIAKPGPYTHAEIQFGGLPSCLSPSLGSGLAPHTRLDGTPHDAEGLVLPSPEDGRFRRLARDWIETVTDQVLLPRRHPHGPVIGIQIGNEGIYCDNARPLSALHDVDSPPDPAAAIGTSDGTRELLRWTRAARGRPQQLLLDILGSARRSLPALNNAAPPSLGGDFDGDSDARIDAWLVRNQPGADDPIHYGFTSWVGNVAHDDEALALYAIAPLVGSGPNCEENWGHLWHDHRYDHALTSIYHHVLALALGASGVNVYNACATSCWGPDIDLDLDHLRASLDDPHLFDPPYCPSAPIAADGRPARKFRELAALLHFLGPEAEGLAQSVPNARQVIFAYCPDAAALAAWGGGAALDEHAPPVSASMLLPRMIPLCLRANVAPQLVNLTRSSLDEVRRDAVVIVAGAPLMSRRAQIALLRHAACGGRIVIVGEPPARDEWLDTCTLVRDAAAASVRDWIVVPAGAWEAELARAADIPAGAAASDTMALTRSAPELGRAYAFVMSRSDAVAEHETDLGGATVSMFLPPRGCAIVAAENGLLRACYIKGIGEHMTISHVELRLGEDVLRTSGGCDLGAVRDAGGDWSIRTAAPDARSIRLLPTRRSLSTAPQVRGDSS